jgi:hypothetical protein
LPWTDDVPEPERDLDELRDVVARKAGRLRNRRRLGLVSGAAALLALLLVVASLPSGEDEPRRLQAADRPDTSTTLDPSSSDTIDPSEVYGEEPTTTVPGQTTSTTAKRKAGTATAAGPTTTAPLPKCGGPTAPLPKEVTAIAAVGVWVACDAPGSFFGTSEAGIEIRGDSRFSKLYRASDGALQRRNAWDYAGDWRSVQQQQVDFEVDGRGTFMGHLTFTADRATMRVESMSGSATYARVTTTVVDAPPTQGDECARDEGAPRTLATESEFRTAISHVWLLCQPAWYFASEGAGLEIRSDGRWWLLGRRADGVLVRGGGRIFGTWTVTDTSSMNGPGHYQLTVRRDGAGENYLHLFFASASTKMRANSMEGLRDHVHAPAGSQVVDG